MDIATVVLLSCILFFSYRGYRAGFVLSAGRILSLVGAYAASLMLAGALSPWLEQQFGLSELAARLIAAIGLFIVVSAGISSLVKMIFKRFPDKLQKSALIKWSGAGLGAASGYLIAVLTLWFYGLMMGAISVADPAMGERLKATAGINKNEASVGQLLVDKTSSAIAEAVLEKTDQDDPLLQASALIMTQPESTLQSLQRLSQDANLRALLQAPSNQRVIQSGNIEELTQLNEFQSLRQNPDMKNLFGEDKLNDEELAQLLITYWNRAESLNNNEELQAALQDPELQEQLKKGNTIAVLSHPGGRKLLGALLSPVPTTQEQSSSKAAGDNGDTSATQVPPPAPTKVYQWVDDQGRTHFTDSEPRHSDSR